LSWVFGPAWLRCLPWKYEFSIHRLIRTLFDAIYGCLSLARPSNSNERRLRSRSKGAPRYHHSEIERSTFLVYASDRRPHSTFQTMATRAISSLQVRWPRAWLPAFPATDIPDSAHVAKEHCYVIGWMDGKLAISPVRVIYKKFGSESGASWRFCMWANIWIAHQIRRLDPAGATSMPSPVIGSLLR